MDNKNTKPKIPTPAVKLPKKNPKNPKHNQIISTVIVFMSVFLIGIILLVGSDSAAYDTVNGEKPKELYELIDDIRDDKVSKIEISENNDRITAELYKNPSIPDRAQIETQAYKAPPRNILQSPIDQIISLVGDPEELKFGSDEGEVIYIPKEKTLAQNLLSSIDFGNLFLILMMITIAIVLIRRIADTNSKALSFGNSNAKMYNKGKQKITFDDVAGNEEAKAELVEVIDFLKRPDAYRKVGAKIPRGILLIGDPGNGKTMMAKAVAGEADVPFLYVSGSEFVEMLVGVGASRVRSLFKAAKKKTPCVIFIDEIDAVGRKRGQGSGGGNDEREQTLNQFLVEMDGFEPSESVIVLAATNRPDVLDRALLRPGRFDRQITVTAPDKKERQQILEVHAKNKKLEDDVDLSIVAKRTPGFSGADLMNVLNEAAILSVREKQGKISNLHLREAIEKVMLGPSLKSKVVLPEEKKKTAYHEAGHAITATVLPKAQKVSKITIIPRGRAAGYTFHAENESDSRMRTKQQFLSEIVTLFGGYTVEEMVFGDISTGASNDLAKATQIAKDMVTKYGMSTLGAVSFQESSMSYNDIAGIKEYSEETGNKIDQEVSNILEGCRNICKDIINIYNTSLSKVADQLIETEILEYEEFEDKIKDIKDSYKPDFNFC